MATEVYKFGGASVKNAEGVRRVAEIIRGCGNNLLVVISAMDKITNELEALLTSYLREDNEAHSRLQAIKDWHFQLAKQLFDANDPVFDTISNAFVEIEWILEEPPADDPAYLYDQIVSMGEVVSTQIVAAFLQRSGIPAQWADARNYIRTDNNYREGNVDWATTTGQIQRSLPKLLEKNVIITQGFIGGTSENFTTTLGREGSDYSAAIFCSCLDATAITIWKDVAGVLNADPKWFDETELIPDLSYHDAIELSYYGATVIHPKTIKPLQNKGIPLFVRSFMCPSDRGTRIFGESAHLPVPSFIFKVNQVLISISPKDFSFIFEESLSTIFGILHKHKVKANTMHQSALSFSISVDDDDKKITGLINELSLAYKVKYNKGVELVTIRYYNQQTIDRISVDKKILLEVKSRYTCQMVMKDKSIE